MTFYFIPEQQQKVSPKENLKINEIGGKRNNKSDNFFFFHTVPRLWGRSTAPGKGEPAPPPR